MRKHSDIESVYDFYSKYCLNDNWIDGINIVISRALNQYANVLMVRFDLHYPARWVSTPFFDNPYSNFSNPMSKFIDSLNAKIKAEQIRKHNQGIGVNPTLVRFVWSRENDGSANDHYHVCLFLNKSRFQGVGRFDLNYQSLFSFIVEAWASALNIDEWNCKGLVYIPNNSIYKINRYSQPDYDKALQRAAYLAKEETKVRRSGVRCFGRSQK